MKVEIWSDVVCPWCYIGKRRFERALADFDRADEVEIHWRSFQLNPEQARGARTTHDEYLAAKMGSPVDQVRHLNARVVALAADEGLEYHFETYQVINTFDTHRVAHLARANGLDDQVQERFLRAQLVEGEILDDPDTLARLGEEIGLDPASVRHVLLTDEFADGVRHDLAEARALGINGVPFLVFDRRFGVSGAQPPEIFLEALRVARDEAGSTSPA